MAALIIGLGILACLAGIWMAQREDRSLRWTQVEGKIISSEAYLEDDGELYTPEIVYEYTAGGATHVGSKVQAFLIQYNWSGPARRLCEKYPTGETVKIYVDPNDPTRAVLVPGIDPHGFWLFFGTGLVFILVGSLMAIR